ncbi:MAG: hypothetical protein H7Y09_04565 [Chitinophagaceae bacterium]|nr:hypothetical protein [Anaerolineae bacterium]
MIFTISPHVAHACSGGVAVTVAGLIADSDYVVKARVTEVDDVGQNVILHIENYLAGGPGPEFLLFNRSHPIRVDYILAGFSGGGDCLGLASAFHSDDELYLFLHRNQDGSYTVVSGAFNPDLYRFPEPHSTVDVYLTGGYQNGDRTYEDLAERNTVQQATETEFIAIIAEQSGQTPTAPDTSLPYPLKAPLRLTTTAGTAYLFPIDGRAPIELTPEILSAISGRAYIESILYDAGSCTIDGCRIYSPDGLNVAVQVDTSTFQLKSSTQLTGQEVLFSPTSDALAVWNECDLKIYTTGYPRLMQDWYAIEEINQIPLSAEASCELFSGIGVWSLDGRYLAYSDDAGLWLWDVFSTTTEPRLIVSDQEGISVLPRYFSPLGRYLAVIQGEERYTLDLVSGESLPDGLVSPDDRLLLAFDTGADSSMLEICALTPYACQPLPWGMYFQIWNEAGELVLYAELSEVSRVEWQNAHSFMALTCLLDEPTQCRLFLWRPSYAEWYTMALSYGSTFAYDANNHTMAIVNDADTVTINDTSYDFAGMLDGDITTIEWMRSLFYQDNSG